MLTGRFAVTRPLPALRGRRAKISCVPLHVSFAPSSRQRTLSLPTGLCQIIGLLTYLLRLVPMAGDDHGSCKSCSFYVSVGGVTGRLCGCCAASNPPRRKHLKKKKADADQGGTERLAVCWGCLLPSDPVPHGLPVQAAKGPFHDPDLSPQYQRKWQHLPRHSA